MGVRVEISPGFEGLASAAGLRDGAALLRRPDTGLVTRHAWRSTQLLRLSGGADLYIKRWFRRPVCDALRDLLSLRLPRSMALVERRALERVAGAGFGGRNSLPLQ